MSSGISVCLITKNEEKMLAGCLDSVRSIADEIILVDTGSTDSTVRIAESYGCRVINSPWQDDFSQSRNVALSKAKFPYILSIDADERIVNPEIIKLTIEKSSPDIGGWLINVVSKANRADGGEDTYISSLLRLFRAHPQIRFSGIIHEQIHESLISLGYRIANTTIEMLHLGYTHSPEQMRLKQVRNLNLLDTAIKNNPNNGYNLFQRAKTHLALGNLVKAEEDISLSLKHVKEGGTVRPQALNFGAVIATQSGKIELANQRALESLKLISNQAFANFILGENFYQLQDFEASLEAYSKMEIAQKTADEKARMAGDYKLPDEQLHYKKGRCFIALKRVDEAYTEFMKGNKANPNDAPCLVGLSNVAFLKSELDKSKDYLLKAHSIDPQNTEIKGYLDMVVNTIRQRDKQQQSNNAPVGKSQNNGRPLITLSMIVKNEEKTLPTCLESVKHVVDEIIIVDTGSTDNTIKIAQSYGAKIYHFEWVNDFAAARNEALKYSTGEWILYLDADESITPESAAIIRDLLLNAPEQMGAYICTIESDHTQLDGGTENHRGGYPRIFRNYGFPKISFQGRVHEQITPAIFALGKVIDLSDIVIIHTGYNRSREEMDRKVRRNYAMLMQHINEEPENAYAWYQLGQTLTQMSLTKEAEKAIRFSLELGSLSGSVYASATATLAQLVGNQRKFSEALHWAEKSLESAPAQVYALHLKAYALMYLNRHEESEAAFHEVLRRINQKKGVPKSGFDISIPEEIVMKGLNEAKQRIAYKFN